MASNIVYTTIDAEYPVAGVDNDTQGFRDNFQIIKDGLGTAQGEITTLQEETCKVNANNDFNGTGTINSALIQDARYEILIEGEPLTTGVTLDVSSAHYFRYVLDAADVTMTVTGWPSDQYAKIVVELAGSGESVDVRTVTWSFPNITRFWKNPSFPSTYTVDPQYADRSVVVELWSYDGGANVYGNYLGLFNAA